MMLAHVTPALALLVAACICFLVAALPMPTRLNLVALGLCFWVLSLLIG